VSNSTSQTPGGVGVISPLSMGHESSYVEINPVSLTSHYGATYTADVRCWYSDIYNVYNRPTVEGEETFVGIQLRVRGHCTIV
jgi:hypothetical protein